MRISLKYRVMELTLLASLLPGQRSFFSDRLTSLHLYTCDFPIAEHSSTRCRASCKTRKAFLKSIVFDYIRSFLSLVILLQ